MSFEYNGSKISVRELTIGQSEDAADIARTAIGEGKTIYARHMWFGQYHVAAIIEGAEPFPRVSADSGAKEIRAAWKAWRDLPDSFSDAWVTELSKIERAVKNESRVQS